MRWWKVSEIRYKWEKYNWWIYCLIIAIAVFLILYYCYPDPDPDQDNARYILSAISQGLAAILALVFTITLVVSQMTRRYTAMDKIIFRPETILLMLVFGFGVVTPLLVLKFGLCRPGISLSIALAVFCVFSLLPFLKGVNRVLKYEFGVNALYREIMVAIESGIEESIDTGELTEIGERAVMEAPENTVVTIIRFLSQIGKKCAEKGLGDETYWVVYKLSDIGVKSVGKGFEEASFFAVKGLKDVGVEAAKNRLKSLFEPANVAIEGLKDIFMVLKDSRELKDKYNKYNAVNGLWCLGAFVTEYMPDLVDFVIKNLKEIEEEIGRDLLMEYEKGCISDHLSDHPNLKSALEEFKRRYNER